MYVKFPLLVSTTSDPFVVSVFEKDIVKLFGSYAFKFPEYEESSLIDIF